MWRFYTSAPASSLAFEFAKCACALLYADEQGWLELARELFNLAAKVIKSTVRAHSGCWGFLPCP